MAGSSSSMKPHTLEGTPHYFPAAQYGNYDRQSSTALPSRQMQSLATNDKKNQQKQQQQHVSHIVMSFETPLPAYNSTDPTATFFSTSCIDLMLIELVPMAYRLTNSSNHAVASGAGKGTTSTTSGAGALTSTAEGTTTVPGAGAASAAMSGEENSAERDAVFFRLDSLGYKVGVGLVER